MQRVTNLMAWLAERHPEVIDDLAERAARSAGIELEREASARHCLAIADVIAEQWARRLARSEP